MKFKHLAFVCLLAALPQAVWAAEPVQLDDMVVTASRHASPLSEVPASVTVITRTQIEATSATRVDEVLKTVPGVDVVRDDGIGGRSYVLMRGTAEQGRTLVLLDGQALNKSEMGQVNWNLVNLADVERIEVVRGATSALYGSNAMGGVINIITRKPADKAISGEVRGSYATFNTGSAGATVSGSADGFSYQLAYDYTQSDGFNPKLPGDRDTITPGDLKSVTDIKRDFKEHQLRTRLAYDMDNADITFGYQHIDEESGQGEEAFFPVANRNLEQIIDRKTDRADLTCNVELDKADISISTFYSQEDYNRIDEAKKRDRKDVDSQRTDGGLSILSTIPAGDHLFSFGLDARYGAVDGKDLFQSENNDASNRVLTNEGNQQIYALFVNGEFTLGDEVILHAGGRYDYARTNDGAFSDTDPSGIPTQKFDDESWDAFSPRVALLWNITDDSALRMAAGSSFRAPILDDMFRNGRTRGGDQIGNPDLDPERLTNIEVGYDQRFGTRTSMGATAYYSRIKDFFESMEVADEIMQAKNVGNVEIYGVELETASWWTDWFSTWANATFTSTEIKEFDENPELEGNHLIDTPPLKWNVGLSFDLPTLGQFDWVYRYTGRRYGDEDNSPEEKLEDYLVVDVKYTKRFSDRAELTFAVNDLFDDQYRTGEDTQSPGRYATLGCTVRF